MVSPLPISLSLWVKFSDNNKLKHDYISEATMKSSKVLTYDMGASNLIFGLDMHGNKSEINRLIPKVSTIKFKQPFQNL